MRKDIFASSLILEEKHLTIKNDVSPGWCGSVVERWPANQRVAGWIPSQGTGLGWAHAGQVPSREHLRGNHTLMFLSLSFSLPSPL